MSGRYQLLTLGPLSGTYQSGYAGDCVKIAFALLRPRIGAVAAVAEAMVYVFADLGKSLTTCAEKIGVELLLPGHFAHVCKEGISTACGEGARTVPRIVLAKLYTVLI